MNTEDIKTGTDLKQWRKSYKPSIRRQDIADVTDYSYSRICTVEQLDEEIQPKLRNRLVEKEKDLIQKNNSKKIKLKK